jgi:2-hydroxy-3-oxopropionate reductase
MKTIGFIGLGIMGKPMATNLIRAGYELIVHDINRVPVRDVVQLGATEGHSPAEVASRSEIVITMLPNSPEVRAVVLGDGGVLEGAHPGLILIDMSSIAPLVSKDVATAAQAKGIKMLDAPVSGGEPKAKDGTLSIMVGGEKETFDSVVEVLQAMGKSVVWIGPIGSGNIAKLSNQIVVALNIIAISEALVLAKKAGVDPKVVHQAIRGGLAGSTVMDAKAPLIFARKFDPGFRIELHLKDLLNAVDTAHQLCVPIPFSGLATEVMSALKVAGKGALDHGGIVQYFEALAGVEVC